MIAGLKKEIQSLKADLNHAHATSKNRFDNQDKRQEARESEELKKVRYDIIQGFRNRYFRNRIFVQLLIFSYLFASEHR